MHPVEGRPVKDSEMDSNKVRMEKLLKGFREKRSVVVAFSGGVDSSVVSALAFKALGEKALAVTIDSPLLPRGELEDAKKIADEIGIKHLVVRLNEFEDPNLAMNPPDRCYICKKMRFKKLREMANEGGFNEIADGSNFSDLGQHRPGLKAAKEEGVYHPLMEAGLSKEDTRILARLLNLSNADNPSSSCLASRVPYGQKLTSEKMERIAQAENYVREMTGVKVLRVREQGDLARIEVGVDERRLFYDEELMSGIAGKLKQLGYRFVTLDLEGYRFGSFDDAKGKVIK